jgi:hypothetical protein
MPNILELSPQLSQADSTEHYLVNGSWNGDEETRKLAVGHGHPYTALGLGGHAETDVRDAVRQADAVVFVPTDVPRPAAQLSGGVLSQRVLGLIAAEQPAAHIVLVSHFLTGHSVTHRNWKWKGSTWAVRVVEAQLRAGPNPWTILRPTWFADHDDAHYQVRLTQNPHTDGFVSPQTIAQVVVAALETPSALGVTAGLYNVNAPGQADVPLTAQFAKLDPDYEYQESVR